MFLSFRRSALWGACLATGLSLAACGSFDSASHQLASAITPYRMEIVQGNFVSKEQVAWGCYRPAALAAQLAHWPYSAIEWSCTTQPLDLATSCWRFSISAS